MSSTRVKTRIFSKSENTAFLRVNNREKQPSRRETLHRKNNPLTPVFPNEKRLGVNHIKIPALKGVFNSSPHRLTQTLLSSKDRYVRVCSLPLSLLPDVLSLLGDGG